MEFVKKHLFEILISAIVGSLGYIGKQELDRLHKLTCTAVATSVAAGYENVSQALGGMSSFDDLRDNSKPVRALQQIATDFSDELQKCDKGKNLLKEIHALLNGLRGYIRKDYTAAAKNFETMNMENSLPHHLLGAAYAHASMNANGLAEIARLRRQAEDQLSQALHLAREESGGTVKEAVLLNIKCKQHLVARTPDANVLAEQCFRDVIAKKYDDYNTHYNLACIYSRMGRFKEAVASFVKYMDNGGSIKDARVQAEKDPDFENVLKSEQAGAFKAQLNRYQR
jgi:hypothetical protein